MHFARIGEKRGDEEKRLAKLKEYANPKDQDSYLLANNQAVGGKSAKDKDKGKEKKGDEDEAKAVKKSKSQRP